MSNKTSIESGIRLDKTDAFVVECISALSRAEVELTHGRKRPVPFKAFRARLIQTHGVIRNGQIKLLRSVYLGVYNNHKMMK